MFLNFKLICIIIAESSINHFSEMLYESTLMVLSNFKVLVKAGSLTQTKLYLQQIFIGYLK